jgi:ribosomal protein L16 Arg81 hydroxylase
MTTFYSQYDTNVIGWQELLNNFNESAERQEHVKHVPLGFFVSHSANRMPKVQSLMKKLGCDTAHLYMNVSQHGGSFGRHVDDVDVYFWQCQGSSKWVMDDCEFILTPGDMIYVPKGIYHNVIPLTPRAGISMGQT